MIVPFKVTISFGMRRLLDHCLAPFWRLLRALAALAIVYVTPSS